MFNNVSSRPTTPTQPFLSSENIPEPPAPKKGCKVTLEVLVTGETASKASAVFGQWKSEKI